MNEQLTFTADKSSWTELLVMISDWGVNYEDYPEASIVIDEIWNATRDEIEGQNNGLI